MTGNLISTYRALNRSEKALLIGQAASVVGDFMALPAFAILAARREPIVLTLFFVCYFLPRCAQPFLGVLVDRFNAKWVALWADAARATIFMFLFCYPADYPSAPWLLAAFAASSFGALFEPARLKIMSAIAGEFVSYSRIFNVAYSFGGIASLGSALLVERYFRTEAVFAANALTFIISFAFLMLVTYQHQSQASVEDTYPWLKGFRLFIGHRAVLVTCGLVILVDFFTGVLYETFPHKAALLGFDETGTYVFYFLVCLGNTLGALCVRPGLAAEKSLAWLCAAGACSGSIFVLGASWSMLLVACLCFFSVQILAIVAAEIVIQRDIPHECQGRVFGISESFPYLALSLGSVVGGTVGGIGVAAVCIVSFALFYLATSASARLKLFRVRA